MEALGDHERGAEVGDGGAEAAHGDCCEEEVQCVEVVAEVVKAREYSYVSVGMDDDVLNLLNVLWRAEHVSVSVGTYGRKRPATAA
jgi:hypothetical protein